MLTLLNALGNRGPSHTYTFRSESLHTRIGVPKQAQIELVDLKDVRLQVTHEVDT